MSETISTGTDDLLAGLDNGVLTLTLNRPDARNAMSGAMTAALAAQLAEAELNPAVKVIVLTGAGKGFCAGGDVKGMAASGDGTVGDNTIDGAIHRQRVNQRNTAGKLYSMPKPTIAALPGAAAGAGLSLALACDLRIMSRAAIVVGTLTSMVAIVGVVLSTPEIDSTFGVDGLLCLWARPVWVAVGQSIVALLLLLKGRVGVCTFEQWWLVPLGSVGRRWSYWWSLSEPFLE